MESLISASCRFAAKKLLERNAVVDPMTLSRWSDNVEMKKVQVLKLREWLLSIVPNLEWKKHALGIQKGFLDHWRPIACSSKQDKQGIWFNQQVSK